MPDLTQLGSRQVAHVHAAGASINIEHLWQAGEIPCPGCSELHDDPGLVGLTLILDLDDEDDNAGDESSAGLAPLVMAVMEPGVALVVANRLERAAALALEGTEDPPDFSREARRMTTALVADQEKE